jgi:hypothetical protein
MTSALTVPAFVFVPGTVPIGCFCDCCCRSSATTLGKETNGVADKGGFSGAGVFGLLGFHGMKLASVEPIADTGDRMAKGDDDVVGNAIKFFSPSLLWLEKEGGVDGVVLPGVGMQEKKNDSSSVAAVSALVDMEAEAGGEKNEVEEASEDCDIANNREA